MQQTSENEVVPRNPSSEKNLQPNNSEEIIAGGTETEQSDPIELKYQSSRIKGSE